MDLYFECTNGISGDMAVAALLDLGASREKLEKALKSLNLEDEFSYKISTVSKNSIRATDFDVVLPQNHTGRDSEIDNKSHHHHTHRNLDEICKILETVDADENVKNLSKKIFKIVAEAEAKVHQKPLQDVHFHEIGAIDSIADILAFSTLFCDLNPENVYFSALGEGMGSIACQHGILPVPVPAVCEIVSLYGIPIKITDNDGEMITPTGAAIAAALYVDKKLPEPVVIEKIGYGAGKRPYKSPFLRVFQIK